MNSLFLKTCIFCALATQVAFAQELGRDHARTIPDPSTFELTDASDKLHSFTPAGTKLTFMAYGEVGKPVVEKIDSGPYLKTATTYELEGESDSFAGFVTLIKGDQVMPDRYLKGLVDGAVNEVLEMEGGEGKLLHRVRGSFGSVKAERVELGFTSEGHQMVLEVVTALTPEGIVSINCLHEKGDSAGDSEATAFLASLKYGGAGFLEDSTPHDRSDGEHDGNDSH